MARHVTTWHYASKARPSSLAPVDARHRVSAYGDLTCRSAAQPPRSGWAGPEVQLVASGVLNWGLFGLEWSLIQPVVLICSDFVGDELPSSEPEVSAIFRVPYRHFRACGQGDGQEATRYRRWVASGVSITRTISISIFSGNTSNNRRPPDRGRPGERVDQSRSPVGEQLDCQ
jgi:hypothetical protein